MAHKPLALEAYEALAEAYAAAIDTKPHNAYYERPATLSLLPDVTGRRVLDAGCGPGAYAEWLRDHDATVVAVDASPKMVALARQRLGPSVEVRQADLGRPLSFLSDASFDAVVCALVLDYVEDWRGVLSEFSRVLRPGGVCVLSFSHPFYDYGYFDSRAYFATEQVESIWSGFPGMQVRMPSFRRSLGEALNPVLEAGLVLEAVLEPKPTEAFLDADPRHYEELMRQPCFLCLRARKVGIRRASP